MVKLYRMAKASVAAPKGVVEDVIFPAVSEKWLQTLIQEVESDGACKGKVKATTHPDDADYMADLNEKKWLTEATSTATGYDNLECPKCGGEKTSRGMVYFTDGHVDKTDFAAAICQIRKTASVLASNVYYMYSDLDKGRYGIGRRFWNGKVKNSEPITMWMPDA